ncbi:hypothetical protein [Kitasatospora sp. NPDC004531]
MPEPVQPVPSYTWWGDLPPHLVTRTQLAELDLPRQPGGPVRARITATGPHGRKGTFDLFDLGESVPTPATGAQLAAAAARRTTGTRACEQCGARPETPCTQIDGWLLCGACAHVHHLRARQQQAAEQARAAAEQAARLHADERLAVLAVTYTHRPTPGTGPVRPAGRRPHHRPRPRRHHPLRPHAAPDRPPHPRRARRHRRTRPGPRRPRRHPRHPHRGALDDDLGPLHSALRRLRVDHPRLLPDGFQRVHRLAMLVTLWRGDLDPTTGRHRAPTPPGTADRLLHLLRRAATAEPVPHLGETPRPAC